MPGGPTYTWIHASHSRNVSFVNICKTSAFGLINNKTLHLKVLETSWSVLKPLGNTKDYMDSGRDYLKSARDYLESARDSLESARDSLKSVKDYLESSKTYGVLETPGRVLSRLFGDTKDTLESDRDSLEIRRLPRRETLYGERLTLNTTV